MLRGVFIRGLTGPAPGGAREIHGDRNNWEQFEAVLRRERFEAAIDMKCYNLVNRGFVDWLEYHRLAMKVIGREVELVGVPFEDLKAMKNSGFGICANGFAYNSYFSSDKLVRDFPEFHPRISLEHGRRLVLEQMDRDNRVPDSNQFDWEDRIIAAQRSVRKLVLDES